jgi:Bacterial dnaA protein helix-turn-helix
MILNQCAPFPADFYDKAPVGTNPRHVVAEVARRYNVTPGEIRGEWRYPDLMAARREIALRLRADGLSYPVIARELGRRSHTTIIDMLRNQGHATSRKRGWGKMAPPADRTAYFQQRWLDKQARKAQA